ncbi:copper chaperone PCu(A)C [Planomonospora corallina]|uniref:Copper chaperone PCu(A)C n=1 Tax=Planomonospora corallina TaxID=1806052 RepID=A0ABV8IF00_9ACTN
MTRIGRHRAIAAAAFLAAATALTGCGAGHDAITNQHYAPTEATSVTVNGLNISQAFFLGPDSGGTLPVGASTPLHLYMVNSTPQADQLIALGVDPAIGTAKVTTPVPLPAGAQQAAVVGRPTPTVMIEQLKKPLRGGEELEVQLKFEKAGVITLRVPVITRSREFATLSPAQGATTPSPTPTPSATEAHAEGDH